MKIAIYHNLPSGGAKRSLYEWTRRLTQQHELSLYTLSAADESYLDLRPLVRTAAVYPFALPLNNRPLTPAGLALRFADLWRLRALSERIARDVDAGRHDVLFVNHCWYTQAPYLLRSTRTPSVYYCQEPPRWLLEPPPPRAANRPDDVGSSWRYRLARSLFQRTFKRLLIEIDTENARRAGEVLVNSHYSREVAYRTYGRFAHFSPVGVDTAQFHPKQVTREHVVLSVGALAPVKAHDLLIEAAARIPESRRPAVDIAADRGPEAERVYLQHLADCLGVRVTFHQRVSDERLVDLYNRAKVTACVSIMEPFGLVPLESMACSTPVVAVREGGLRESVQHGETGLLTERDPDELARALDELLSDEASRERLGRQGRAYVADQWTWEKSTRQLEQHLARAAQWNS